MKWKFQSLLCSALILASVIAPASALEYHYEADLYDNYFCRPTSSNHALDLDSADDNGGSAIVIASESMDNANEQAPSNSSPIIPLGAYIDPWGPTVDAQIQTDEKLNGLAGLSFNRAYYNETCNRSCETLPLSHVFTERSEVAYTNGHFGAVSIGNRGLFAYVYPSASTDSMRKGAGQVDGTSVWNGNVVLAGHNRGSWPHFQTLKNVKPGDVITYKTSLGTRTYRVTYAGRVGSTDTSVLAPTYHNQITLLSCVANEPAYRFCVVGQEIR